MGDEIPRSYAGQSELILRSRWARRSDELKGEKERKKKDKRRQIEKKTLIDRVSYASLARRDGSAVASDLFATKKAKDRGWKDHCSFVLY